MNKLVKYSVFSIAIFLFLLVTTVALLPILINERSFIPGMERKVAEITGRSFSVGRDLNVSFFPWLSVTFSDMKLGNPPGFARDEFLSINSFEARVELLPLLIGQVRIGRLVMAGLEVNLEKRSDGAGNWVFGGDAGGTESSTGTGRSFYEDLFPKNVFVDLFAVTGGQITIKDRVKNTEHRIDNVMVLLGNMSLHKPVTAELKGKVDNIPMALQGEIGPLAMALNNEPLGVDLHFVVADELKGKVWGKLFPFRSPLAYNLSLQVASFSPHRLCDRFGVVFPLDTADPDVFHSLLFNCVAKGDSKNIRVEKGSAFLDKSQVDFTFMVKRGRQLDINIDLDLDHLDLDRYLPEEGSTYIKEGFDVEGKLPDIADIVFVGEMRAESLLFKKGVFKDCRLHFSGGNGVYTVDPASFSLRHGRFTSTVTVNMANDFPRITAKMEADRVPVESLFANLGINSLVSGELVGNLKVDFSGTTTLAMKESLQGRGNIVLRNGVLHNISLSEHSWTFGGEGKGGSDEDDGIATPYLKIDSTFTARDGVFDLRNTTLSASLLEAELSGTVDIVSGELDFKLITRPIVVAGEKSEKHPVDSGFFTIFGDLDNPEVAMDVKGGKDGTGESRVLIRPKNDVQRLVDDHLPSPVEEDVKGLIGRSLVDPSVVAQRFGLQPLSIHATKVKKLMPVGSGKVRVEALLEEDGFLERLSR